MELYSNNKDYKLYKGSMLDMLEVIEPNSIDAIITDPPYELGFMGKSWDSSGIAFQKETWEKCFKVLKPGGHLLAFGGSRTFHRIAVAIEDAGFEIRDTIMYLYGSGFPKSHNIGLDIDKLNGCPDRGHRIAVANRHHPDGTLEPNGEHLEKYEGKTENGKKWAGWGTQLKPAYEPIILARKPLEESSVAKNVLKYGVGGINIDECRVGVEEILTHNAPKGTFAGGEAGRGSDTSEYKQHNGRFPANVIHDGSDEAISGMPDTSSSESLPNNEKTTSDMNVPFANHKSGYHFGDSGSASRYFYCAKAGAFDRDEGLDSFKKVRVGSINGANNDKEELDDVSKRFAIYKRNIHPTVKPTNLMRYLVRLVSPKGATILDPFNGSGSTGKAVMLENKEFNKEYKYIGIELTDEYLPIAKARIEYICNNDFVFTKNEDNNISKHEVVDKSIPSLFDFLEE